MLTLYFILVRPTRKSAAASKKRKQDSDDGEAISPVKKRMRPRSLVALMKMRQPCLQLERGWDIYGGEVLRQVLATSNPLKTWLYVTDLINIFAT